MRWWLPVWALLAVLFCLPASVRAEAPLSLEGEAARFSLRGHLWLLNDPTGRMEVGEVAAHGGFQSRPPWAQERSYTNGAVWYRFTVMRRAGMPAEWILAIGEPFIDDVRVFSPSPGGGWDETRLGRRFSNNELGLAARRHLAALHLPEGEPATILVRLSSSDEIQFEAQLWRKHAILFAEARQSLFFGMFFTMLIFIVAIYLLFGAWLRDAPMIAYALYISTFILFGGSHTGILPLMFPSLGGQPAHVLAGIGVLGNVAAMAFMWDRVLGLRDWSARWHRVYMAAVVVALGSFAAIPTPLYIHLIQPTFIATMVITVASLALAAVKIRRGLGNSLVNFYVVAFIPFLLFSIAHAAEVLVPDRVSILVVRQVSTFAMLAHIIILSIALARRVGMIRSDRLRAEADLAATRLAMAEHRNFVGMLSHQIGTSLAVISSTIDLQDLRGPRGDETARIRKAVMRMRDLTADVLAESRMTEVVGDLDVRRVDLVPLLAGLCDERREMAPQTIRFERGPAFCYVFGDRVLLEILFANLLDNAIKYSLPEGGIRLTIRRRDGLASVTVSDDGPGIAAGEIERVFEKFYRPESVSDLPGTGLGLYLVRRIAERHGGSVALDSPPGRGATFTVTLPVAGRKG